MLRYVIKVCGQNIITSDRPDTQNHCVHCISDLSFQKLRKLIWCPQLFNVLTLSRKKQSLSKFEPWRQRLAPRWRREAVLPSDWEQVLPGAFSPDPLTPWPPLPPCASSYVSHNDGIRWGIWNILGHADSRRKVSWLGNKRLSALVCYNPQPPPGGGGVSQMYCFDQNL